MFVPHLRDRSWLYVLTMIDTATSWPEIMKLPVVGKPTTPLGTLGCKGFLTCNNNS